MFAVQCEELELVEGWSANDPTLRGRFDFPISVETGAASSSVVYFELGPGRRCGRHTHSAEEVLLVLDGDGEAEVDGERVPVTRGGLVLVPARAPHEVHNTGGDTIKVIGFLSAAAVVTEIEEPLQPMNTAQLVIGASEPEADGTEPTATSG